MDIDIHKYLSDDEIKDICINEIKSSVRELLGDKKDRERILYNAGHQHVVAAINEYLGEDKEVSETIRDNAIKVINDLSSYTVFKGPDAWDRGTSFAYDKLQESIRDHQDIIDNRVEEVMLSRDYAKDMENIESSVAECLIDLMFQARNGGNNE